MSIVFRLKAADVEKIFSGSQPNFGEDFPGFRFFNLRAIWDEDRDSIVSIQIIPLDNTGIRHHDVWKEGGKIFAKTIIGFPHSIPFSPHPFETIHIYGDASSKDSGQPGEYGVGRIANQDHIVILGKSMDYR